MITHGEFRIELLHFSTPAAEGAAAAAPTAPAEPEVIKKGKKEDAEEKE
jgi:hypothetical protein